MYESEKEKYLQRQKVRGEKAPSIIKKSMKRRDQQRSVSCMKWALRLCVHGDTLKICLSSSLIKKKTMEYNSEGSLEKVETFYADVWADLITETNASIVASAIKPRVLENIS